jgi:hypothetical protein
VNSLMTQIMSLHLTSSMEMENSVHESETFGFDVPTSLLLCGRTESSVTTIPTECGDKRARI